MIRKIIKSVIICFAFLAFGIFANIMLVSMKKEVAKVSDVQANKLLVSIKALTPIQETIEVSNYGTVQPRTVLSLNTELDGKVLYVHPDLLEGNLIPKDTLLITLDKSDFSLAEKRIQANLLTHELSLESLKVEEENLKRSLSTLQRQLEIAEKEKLRYETLLKEKSVSPSEYNKIDSSYQTAKISLISTENSLRMIPVRRKQIENLQILENIALEQAQLNLKRTEIRLPFTGRVLKKYVEPGQYISKGKNLLDIYDTSCLEVKIPLSISELEWLLPDYYFALNRNPSSTFAPSMENCNIKIYLSRGNSNVFWNGKLRRIAPEIDQSTRTLGVIVEIEDSSRRQNPPLLKGMFVKAVFQSVTLKNVYRIPRNLITNDNKVCLFEKGKLKLQEIEIIRFHNDFAYISNGLKTNDQLITSILSNIVEGMDVEISSFSLESEKKL